MVTSRNNPEENKKVQQYKMDVLAQIWVSSLLKIWKFETGGSYVFIVDRTRFHLIRFQRSLPF